MPKTRVVAVGAGPGYTSIFATIPCHYFSIVPDGDRNVSAMMYKLPGDNFTAILTTDASSGDFIERIGPGIYSFIGVPAAFTASGSPATELVRMKFADDVARNVVVYESEFRV